MAWRIKRFRGGAAICFEGRRYCEGDIVARLSPEAERVYAARGWIEQVDAAPAGGEVDAAPQALDLMTEWGIDPDAIRGSGPGGRIYKRDVEAYIAEFLDDDDGDADSDEVPF